MATRSLPPSAGLWVLRVVWVLVALAAGPAVGAALDGRSAAVQVVASTMAWTGWAGMLVATLVPRATSLTAVRLGVGAGLAAAAWAAGPASPDGDLTRGVAAVAVAAAAAAVAAAPAVVDAFVNGSAYGSERRFALRCPPALGALAVVTGLAVLAGVAAGPLLLAARQWALGGLALVVGTVVDVVGGRAVHGLARRWLVFVPSGVVVHDPVGRPEAVMAPRPLILSLGPAPADTDAVDLTLGALGLVLVMTTTETLPVTVRERGRRLATTSSARIAFAPARPAAVLAEAASRRIPLA